MTITSDDETPKRQRTWHDKFHDAFRGAKRGIRGQSSFFVHFFAATLVVAAALALDASRIEWCVLLICITIVMTAEMFNSALEHMARAIGDDYHPALGNALDIGSAAVLTASIGAATVGCVVFIYRIGVLMNW
ncbi:MAG: diacylglycerol kinase [Pirellulales bacterium]|nr:diacylglycerol kinase [Planctomycetales bacterium]